MFNYHSLIPWGSFRGRQDEKWGSFRGRYHFGVDLGIISGLRIISGSGSFWGLYSTSPRRVTRSAVPGNPLRWGKFSPCECWRWGGVMFSWAFIRHIVEMRRFPFCQKFRKFWPRERPVSVSYEGGIGGHLWRCSTYLIRPEYSKRNQFIALIREFGKRTIRW